MAQEIMVHCVDVNDDVVYGNVLADLNQMPDDEFIGHSQRQGLVWTLEGFQEAFNGGDVSGEWMIRFIRSSTNSRP